MSVYLQPYFLPFQIAKGTENAEKMLFFALFLKNVIHI